MTPFSRIADACRGLDEGFSSFFELQDSKPERNFLGLKLSPTKSSHSFELRLFGLKTLCKGGTHEEESPSILVCSKVTQRWLCCREGHPMCEPSLQREGTPSPKILTHRLNDCSTKAL